MGTVTFVYQAAQCYMLCTVHVNFYLVLKYDGVVINSFAYIASIVVITRTILHSMMVVLH